MYSVGQVNLPGRLVSAGRPNVPHDVNRRRIFKIESAENSNRIHRVKDWRFRWIGESFAQAEAFDARTEVGCVQPDNFSVLPSRLREHILVGGNYIGDAHVSVVRVPTGSRDVALEINRVQIV